MKTTAVRKTRTQKRRSSFFRSGSGFWRPQAKLSVGKPGDRYENEADSVADKVLNRIDAGYNSAGSPFFSGNNFIQEKPLAETVSPMIQKQSDEEEFQTGLSDKPELDEMELSGQSLDEEQLPESVGESFYEEELSDMGNDEAEEEEVIQAKASGSSSVSYSPGINVKQQAGTGRRLDSKTRSEMEAGFGADFGDVNIHTGADAAQLNKDFGAQAITYGRDIFFNEGKYNPESKEGKHLLAHELTHTIQQKGMIPNRLQFTIGDGRDLTAPRFAGNEILEACYDGERVLRRGARGNEVMLIQQALMDAGFPLPVYGADGIFGAETEAALISFQRASSVIDSGVLDAATMSSLNALFTRGQPSVFNVDHTQPASIDTETLKQAPDGTGNDRKTVGVGERVRFTADVSGIWSVSAGRIIGWNRGENIVWEAPPVAASAQVTITTPGGAFSVVMNVIAPNEITMSVLMMEGIPSGTAGACMINNVFINPLSVNFGRAELLEVPGPATNVSGYFNQFSADDIFHHPNPDYTSINVNNNTEFPDHAAWHEASAPFSFGVFTWVIPNRYKIVGESDAQGRDFTDTVQTFVMTPNGTMIIGKAGAAVVRTLNDIIQSY